MSKDGGPAFPIADQTVQTQDSYKWTAGSRGISVRDYFAAAALQGLLASPAWEKACVGQPVDEVPSVAAEAVYELADAMLLQRDKS